MRTHAAETILHCAARLDAVRGLKAQFLHERRIDMEAKRNDDLRADPPAVPASLARGIGWGLIGGVAGTIVMDLVLMGALSAAGLPALTCFSIVGNTVARFFSQFGLETAGGVPAGVAAHYVVGPLFGTIYGAAVIRIALFKADSLGKSVLCAVLYGEILSQPVLAMAPILLKMSVMTTLQWYGGSFVMHFLWGVVTGIIVGYGLKIKKNTHPVSFASPHPSIDIEAQ